MNELYKKLKFYVNVKKIKNYQNSKIYRIFTKKNKMLDKNTFGSEIEYPVLIPLMDKINNLDEKSQGKISLLIGKKINLINIMKLLPRNRGVLYNFITTNIKNREIIEGTEDVHSYINNFLIAKARKELNNPIIEDNSLNNVLLLDVDKNDFRKTSKTHTSSIVLGKNKITGLYDNVLMNRYGPNGKIINTIECNNYRGNKYAERLIKEWLEYGKLILAADFDSTLSPWETIDNNEDIKRVISIIKFAQEIGIYLSIWTSCDSSRYNEITEYCKSIGIKIDSINENPITLKYGNDKKMYYNHLLDDRSGLIEALNILEYCCYRVKSEKLPQTNNFDL